METNCAEFLMSMCIFYSMLHSGEHVITQRIAASKNWLKRVTDMNTCKEADEPQLGGTNYDGQIPLLWRSASTLGATHCQDGESKMLTDCSATIHRHIRETGHRSPTNRLLSTEVFYKHRIRMVTV